MPYSSPLITFDGKLVVPKGMIRLPIQTGPKMVEVNFIVVDTYSPYTAIVDRLWLYTLGAVAFSLHQKLKFSSGDQVREIRGSQSMARHCVVVVVSHRLDAESLASVERSKQRSRLHLMTQPLTRRNVKTWKKWLLVAIRRSSFG